MPRSRRIAICVPVRDEAGRLPRLLAALAGQRAAGSALTLCLLLDGCTDGSPGVAEAAARDFPFAVRLASRAPGPPNAGAARQAAMALGLAALDGDGILLTTDADSRPRPDWVPAAIAALAEADVAAGRLVRIAGDGDVVQGRLERYLDRLHRYRRRIDPVPWEAACTTHHSAGANLGFRAAAYRALGGFPAIPSGEDARLLDDAARAGFRVRRDAAMLVDTSSRREARAPGGLAAALRAVDAGVAPRVAHPAGAAWQYRGQAAARRAFATIGEHPVRTALGARLGLDGDHVLGVWRDCPNAEAFAMRVVPAPSGALADVPLAQAEAALDALTRASEPVPA